MSRRHCCFDCAAVSEVGKRERELRAVGWRLLSRSAPAGVVFVWVCPSCAQPANASHSEA